MTISLNFFNAFKADTNNKVHNLGADTLKVMFTNSAPVATNAVLADLTEISTGNGYSAGGISLTTTSSTQTSGTYTLKLVSPTLTASGGTIGPYRYIVLYNSTTVSKNLIGWWDRTASLTLADGDTWNGTFDGTNGVFQLA